MIMVAVAVLVVGGAGAGAFVMMGRGDSKQAAQGSDTNGILTDRSLGQLPVEVHLVLPLVGHAA